MPNRVRETIFEPRTGADGEHLFANLLDMAPVAMALISQESLILNTNRQFARSYLSSTKKQLSSSLYDLVHREDLQALKLAIKAVIMNPGSLQKLEIRIGKPGDAQTWALLQMVTASAQAGSLLVQLTNIDAIKTTTQDLQEQESRWNSALVSSGLGVWDHNFAVGTYFYSNTWKTMRGIPVDEEVPAETEIWIQTVHPDDRQRVLDEIARQNSGEIAQTSFEYREWHRNGYWIWIECRGACVEWDADGHPMRIIGTDIDVSSRKLAEEQLTHVSRRLELALEISNIGVFEVDPRNAYVEWDERMLAMYGKRGESHLQAVDAWESCLHPEDAEAATRRVYDSQAKGDSSFNNEFRIIRKDGETRYIRARIAMFDNGSGHVKVIGANWDITEDVLLQRELERAKGLLEARNAELESSRATIEYNALHDFLTNLPNRRFLDSMLVKRAALASADGSGMAVLNIDLDRFKQINDTLGHVAGDTMLQHAARIMVESKGDGDFVARIGGDEFVLLSTLKGGPEHLEKLADTIISKLCRPITYEGHICRIGGSIGIATDESEDIDAKQLLLKSDIALYQAKSKGRNRYEFFSSNLQNDIINNKHLSDEILVGLEKHEFIPFYQLQFHADTLEIAGVESLARWKHPQRGLLTPDKFLAIAEDLDVVAEIDNEILEQALYDLDRWRQLGIRIPKVSVNVSARRLDDPDLANKLSAYQIAPGTLSFELLETIFLDDTDDQVVANLRMLKRMGIDIEIDDFGTGHASIVSLLKTAPNTLKIDRQLIRPIAKIAEQRKLVSSIIEIGKSLNVKVVAEGVETQEHAQILRDLGCDILQGYALARPMAFEHIQEYIAKGSWRF